ncbi:MAG TPA: DUF5131 family protein [Rubricoccaceae bacterium]|jgi:protein gp37
MADNSHIEWTDHTANLWWGCVEVHAGCDHCYAREFSRNRTGREAWGHAEPRYLTKGVWGDLARYQRNAPAFFAEHGRRQRVFVGSMMDIYEKPHRAVDWKGGPVAHDTGETRRRFFEEVVPACPDLIFLCLTKRPGNVRKYVPAAWLEPDGWPENVWTGTSPVDQGTANTLIPQLLRVPGTRFLSMEPLLGPVDFARVYEEQDETAWNHLAVDVHWVIVGGESGPGARPMHAEWARSLRDQCAEVDVPFLFKQWGSHDADGRPANKKVAGRLLDGRTHDGFPEPSPVLA